MTRPLPPAPFIPTEKIEEISNHLFRRYMAEVGERAVERDGIVFEEFYDSVLYPEYEIELSTDEDLGHDEAGEKVLGTFLPKANAVLIDRCLAHDPRRVFTLYHEVAGHGILHGPHLREAGFGEGQLRTTEKTLRSVEGRYEVQANMMAANVAAPEVFVRFVCWRHMRLRKIKYAGPGRYGLTWDERHSSVHVRSVDDLAQQIAKRIGLYFGGLSNESLTYRVLDIMVHRGDHAGGNGLSAATGNCEACPT